MRRVLTLLAALILATVAVAPVAAQGPPQPVDFLPLPEELPPGFVPTPACDRAIGGDPSVGVLRRYVRQNPHVAPDDVTRLAIGVAVGRDFNNTLLAANDLREAYESDGYTFLRVNDLGGALLGRKVLDPRSIRPSEIVVLLYVRGLVVVIVEWLDYADLPNHVAIVQIGGVVEERVERQARAPQPLPPICSS